MKKLMILSAAALTIFLAMPQFAEATTIQNETAVNQEKAVKYTEITAATLPETITTALLKNYAGYTVENIFQGDNGTYKVIVSKGSVKNVLLFNAKGELLK